MCVANLREVIYTGEIAAEDAPWVLYKLVIATFQMEETKESLAFKGVAERLTLGITRILGVYHVFFALKLATNVNVQVS